MKTYMRSCANTRSYPFSAYAQFLSSSCDLWPRQWYSDGYSLGDGMVTYSLGYGMVPYSLDAVMVTSYSLNNGMVTSYRIGDL